MDDDDGFEPQDGEEPEDQPEPATGGEPQPDPNLAKLRKENHSLRTRLRRSELVAKYGEDVVELIPDELPLKKWEEYAEKVHAKLGERVQGTSTEPETEGTPPAEPTEQEQRLAAVATGPTSGMATTPASAKSAKELYDLYKNDPAAATREAIEKYRAQLGT